MSASDFKSTGRPWGEYCSRFTEFSPDRVREGCQPWVFAHEPAAEQAIVLCHGLTDSPHFLKAIGRHFHDQLGYDVYLPLLQGHGLKHPKGMEGVSLDTWKANLAFAVETAAGKASRVSVGGLSTGGTLSFCAACTDPTVSGDLFLFSAALDLAGGPKGLIGELKERLLRTFLADLLDSRKPLIGPNPYRYARMDMDGARELARLIEETDRLMDGFDDRRPFPKRVFAAHSESDTTADIQAIRDLRKKTPAERFEAFIIPREKAVPHASLVLAEPIFASDAKPGDPPLETANPMFDEMMAAISAFVNRAF
ncbi:hypothetical protein DSCO28_47880 [Desulfosarcina ovata subsp. sediminis]|uniref:Serine aminopeptidase S33 domain-containing protein n=1 Tax=Desulfosarcina ovata subsp. sediminis TaxID=885957 RepID=A0A5K7ZVF4_9BACT|nr:alpha/beta hydrolase [Desulfosarcina ovata]BBO84222.1 hypothetical protein DSCO28_47880 [Desulfosarcina ovata subsp. sediminis]